jgi:cell fate regulator YaaT (PSP1 superfamily)
MKYSILARYGAMRSVARFATDMKNLRTGNKCILRTSRGTELGEAVAAPERNSEVDVRPEGAVLRRATPADLGRAREIEDVEQEKEFAFCNERIRARDLPMRLASAEHIFGGEKIIFYFLADGRVDFRQLVKDLAAEYRTRIELRQIGVRDEARLLAEYEHCGRELCCRTFIKDLEPVTMRMAKLQKTTLDPTKISGRCGRLKCCLRFEDETYSDLKRQLPKKGRRVRVAEGIGEVVASEILAQTVTVELNGRRTLKVAVDDIQEVLPEEKPKKHHRSRRDRGGRGETKDGGQRTTRSDGRRDAKPRHRSDGRKPPTARSEGRRKPTHKSDGSPPRGKTFRSDGSKKGTHRAEPGSPPPSPEPRSEKEPPAEDASGDQREGGPVANEWWED